MVEIKDLVSVVVMCYNNENLLEDTMQSILKQTYRPLEVIISDDCSKTYDKSVIDKYVLKCHEKNIKTITNHNDINVGTVKHFNKLIQISNGEYIFPLSCGDLFYNEDSVDKIVDCFKKSDCLLVSAKRAAILKDGEKILPTKRKCDILRSNSERILTHIYKYVDLISGANTYYKKAIFKKFGLFDEEYVLLEDCPFYVKVLEQNEKIYFLDEITIKYDCSGVSTGKKLHPLVKKDMLHMFEAWLEKPMSYFTRRIVKYRIKKEKANNIFVFNLCYIDVVFVLAYNRICNKYKG